MRKVYEVICSRYANGGAYGVELCRQEHKEERDAILLAQILMGQGRSVVIRPKFNETTIKAGDEVPELDGFFREWRSFDGGAFKECSWPSPLTPGSDEPSANEIVRLLEWEELV